MEVLKVLHYKAGYEVRTIKYEEGEIGGGPGFTHRVAFTPSGDYIGEPKDDRYQVVERGIAPEKIDADHNVCSIGFSERAQKWYGWSHRALCGFVVGDAVKRGDCTAEYMSVGFTAQTLDDARQMAVAFARSVS